MLKTVSVTISPPIKNAASMPTTVMTGKHGVLQRVAEIDDGSDAPLARAVRI